MPSPGAGRAQPSPRSWRRTRHSHPGLRRERKTSETPLLVVVGWVRLGRAARRARAGRSSVLPTGEVRKTSSWRASTSAWGASVSEIDGRVHLLVAGVAGLEAEEHGQVDVADELDPEVIDRDASGDRSGGVADRQAAAQGAKDLLHGIGGRVRAAQDLRVRPRRSAGGPGPGSRCGTRRASGPRRGMACQLEGASDWSCCAKASTAVAFTPLGRTSVVIGIVSWCRSRWVGGPVVVRGRRRSRRWVGHRRAAVQSSGCGPGPAFGPRVIPIGMRRDLSPCVPSLGPPGHTHLGCSHRRVHPTDLSKSSRECLLNQ